MVKSGTLRFEPVLRISPPNYEHCYIYWNTNVI